MRYYYFSINEYKESDYDFCYTLAKRMEEIFQDEIENRLISTKIDYFLENVRKLAKEKNCTLKK